MRGNVINTTRFVLEQESYDGGVPLTSSKCTWRMKGVVSVDDVMTHLHFSIYIMVYKTKYTFYVMD